MAKKQTATSTDPNVIYQQLAQMPMGGATSFDQTYNDAVNKYKAAQNSTYVLPDVLKSYLGQVSPQYTQDKQAVLNQFADKSSPLYISNPFARLQAAQAAMQGQQQTYSQILDRVNRLVGMGVNQQQQNVQELGSQVTGAQQAQKDARAAMQQQFSNAESLQRLALSRAAAASNGSATATKTAQKEAYNTAFQQIIPLVSSNGEEGKRTREEAIQYLATTFPFMNYEDIKKQIYYSVDPSDYERQQKEKALVNITNLINPYTP